MDEIEIEKTWSGLSETQQNKIHKWILKNITIDVETTVTCEPNATRLGLPFSRSPQYIAGKMLDRDSGRITQVNCSACGEAIFQEEVCVPDYYMVIAHVLSCHLDEILK